MDMISYISKHFRIDPQLVEFVFECEKEVAPIFKLFQETAQVNQFRVIEAFQKNSVSARHFYASTGYGYGDEGREKLCRVFADAFGAEDAIVSPMLMSGTHAISTALFGLLRPGDTLYSLTGKPYDTLLSTLYGASGSLEEYGIRFNCAPLESNGMIDIDTSVAEIKKDPSVKVVYLQRSTGYEIRPAFTTEDLGRVISVIRSEFPDKTIMVDNCYGEFVCTEEPTAVGADIIAGSLIKNPGGGIAPTGGYIAGKSSLIEKIAGRFSAPGIGTEIGSYAFGYQQYYQGFFMAPHTVCQALQGVALAARVFEQLGYQAKPSYDAVRGDITQSIIFGSEEPMTGFIRGIQRSSAIDGHVVPYAWDMPGYDDKVIMAAGTFVQGASVELTADGPIREPYAAYLQGALTYEHAKLGILYALDSMGVTL
ncbi:methionine gamma-lyase family protein [Christensenella tenuis]|jgi:cystathionine beta-lyase family protein involved in aluminum resistance|uniref:Methionine gamma-lyase family protein n=1 Tax=Christensenella tenuis TaxID=2763033 RepID=A0ABR7EBK6_9FIRM|nr:methionine gamma-lyase family protein [Christensenella tenuis]MBC5647156.1 methionine gamma-lyase family protein [Christensenella tenuis]